MDAVLENILIKLKSQFACHTAILYGSRARGDFSANSDYDVLGVSQLVDDVVRDARKFRGKYVDVFVYPEVALRRPVEAHLFIRGGMVLFEKNGFGTKFLKKLDRIYSKGPTPNLKSEIQVKKIWAEKMFSRAKLRDPEGNYRRLWLITSLLPDYFAIRNKWYMGSKAGLAELKRMDAKTHELYLKALEHPFDDANLRKLISRITSE